MTPTRMSARRPKCWSATSTRAFGRASPNWRNIGKHTGGGLHHYRFGRKFYRRVLGEAAPRESFTGRESRWRGSKLPRPGVQNDQAENRVKDMDDEGTDIHFLIPGSLMSFVGLDDPAFEVGMARAYHRHMADFCGRVPEPAQRLDRRLDARCRGGGARDPRMG